MRRVALADTKRKNRLPELDRDQSRCKRCLSELETWLWRGTEIISNEWAVWMIHWVWRFTGAHVFRAFIQGWSINIHFSWLTFIFLRANTYTGLLIWWFIVPSHLFGCCLSFCVSFANHFRSLAGFINLASLENLRWLWNHCISELEGAVIVF